MKDTLFLIDYHLWAHNKVLQQLTAITTEEWTKELGGSFPSLKEVYKHLVISDHRWLQRWKGVPFADVPDDFVFDSFTQLAVTWQPILEEMHKTAHQFFETGGGQPVYFITSKGAQHTMPFWQTLYQVVNHGTYHRGQVTNLLRMLNKEAVSTDIFLFFAEQERQMTVDR